MTSTGHVPCWDAIAGDWVAHIRRLPGDEGDRVRKHMLNPVLFHLLGDITGKRVVDIGCGEGYLARMMARRGARVTGVDGARSILAHARKREEQSPLNIRYAHGDATALDVGALGQFDRAVSSMVFNMLTDHVAAFRGVFSLLKPGGVFVLSIIHPAFDEVGGGWIVNERGEWRYSANRYFDRVEGRAASGMRSFHRCISDYVSAGIDAGGVLTAFKEPIFSGELDRALPAAQQPYSRIPVVLVMRFAKAKKEVV